MTKKNWITLLIFFQWMLYENVFFLEPKEFFGNLFVVIFALKLCIPFIIFYSSNFQVIFIKKGQTSLYILFFITFILWSFIPTLLHGNLFSWVKLVPVFVYFLAITSFFYSNADQVYLLFKMIIIYFLLSLIDYLLICSYDFSFIGLVNHRIQANTIFLPDLTFPRMVGLWKEPSNTSLIAFISYFLGIYLFKVTGRKIWRYTAYLCVASGVLCLSSAGYFAFLLALLYRSVRYNKSEGIFKKWLTYLMSVLAVFLIFFTVYSRYYFKDNETENSYIVLLSGVKSNADDYDPSSGRVYLMKHALQNIGNNPLGYGMQATGAKGTVSSSASAPFFWLTLTGIPGFVLLMLRDLTLVKMFKRTAKFDEKNMFLVQCLVCVLAHHLINGSVMDATYVIFSSLILISYKKTYSNVRDSGNI